LGELEELIEEALQHSAEDALRLIKELRDLLKEERGDGAPPLRRSLGLVEVSGGKEALVIGDLHGDLESLKYILNRESLPRSFSGGDKILVCLGDYVDRGRYSLEVLYVLSKLKYRYPKEVLLLRGNHEPPPGLIPYPHDLPIQARLKYGHEGEKVYDELMELFQLLPHSAITSNGAFLVHGGIPVKVWGLADIDKCRIDVLEELLWNDPSEEVEGWSPSPRGAGKLFGRKVTEGFLGFNDMKVIIRGHEPCEGHKFNHGGRVITLFSRKGPPYYNSKASYLRLKLGTEPSLEEIRRGLVTF